MGCCCHHKGLQLCFLFSLFIVFVFFRLVKNRSPDGRVEAFEVAAHPARVAGSRVDGRIAVQADGVTLALRQPQASF